MSSNGSQRPLRPRIEIRQSTASPEEAAAVAAAIEQFMRDTAPAPTVESAELSPWLEAALVEGTRRHPEGSAPWGGSQPSRVMG